MSVPFHSFGAKVRGDGFNQIKEIEGRGKHYIKSSLHAFAVEKGCVDESNRLFRGVKPTLAMLDIYTTYTTYTIYTIYTIFTHPNNPNNPSGRLITR